MARGVQGGVQSVKQAADRGVRLTGGPLMNGKALEVGTVIAIAIGLVVWPLLTPQVAHFYGSLSAIYALIGLSLVILIGWTGQISLGHAAFVGVGCYFGAKMLNNDVPLVLTIPLIGLIGAAVSLILGIPSLRLRGVYFTIATLAFGAACQQYFFTRPEVRGIAADQVPRADLVGIQTTTDRGLYYAVLVVLAIALVLAYNTRRTDVGRVLFAIRDSEQAAQAMAIKIAPYKIGLFAASAALASIAGLFYGMLFQATPAPEQFSVLQSLFYLAMPVLGGAEALLGALVGGAFLAVGQPLVNLFDVRLFLVTSLALLLTLLSGFDGVTGALKAARKAIADAVRGEPVRYGSFVPHEEHDHSPPTVHATAATPPAPGSVVKVRIVSGVRS